MPAVLEDDHPDRDWTQPGVFRCAPDVYRIPLPLPQDGLHAVNVYAIAHGDGPVTLVDGGWALAGSRSLLADALDALGSGLADVERYLVTHVHRDHYTQAAVLATEFGSRLALGRGEQPGLLATVKVTDAGNMHESGLIRAGAESLLRELEALGAPPDGELDAGLWRDPDEWLDDGARLTVGPRALVAVETPGHTRGHMVFADDAAGLLFAGDHVLPRITPSIGFEPTPPRSPLGDFLDSLHLIRARPDAVLLAAHGPVGMRVHERVDQLLEHHAERLDATLAAVAEGRSTAFEAAHALTWTRRKHALVDMDLFNTVLAVQETYWHLVVLAERGVVSVRSQDGVDHYTM